MAAERVAGLKGIAAALGCAPDTVIALASRPWDPLPLRRLEGSVWGWQPYLLDWQRRQEDLRTWRARRPRGLPAEPYYSGWEGEDDRGRPGISLVVGAGVSATTAQGWARLSDRPLPVIGCGHPYERLTGADGLSRVWIYASALRDWLQARDTAYRCGEARPRGKPGAQEGQLELFG